MTKQEHDALVDEMLTLMTPTCDSAQVQRLCEIRNLLTGETVEVIDHRTQPLGLNCS